MCAQTKTFNVSMFSVNLQGGEEKLLTRTTLLLSGAACCLPPPPPLPHPAGASVLGSSV